MGLLAETVADGSSQLVGYGAITAAAVLVNQAFSMYREYRKDKAKENADAVANKVQARRDDLAIRKDELAVCTAEDDHVVSGYEKLLGLTNKRLTDVEQELTDVYIKLGNCEREHARTEERCKHFEFRITMVEAKYTALRKKVSGFDSDTIIAPEAPKPPEPNQ